ncbi:hypothetical protein Tco_1547034 [Tanacetum coccineum]
MRTESWQIFLKNHPLRFSIVASSSVPWIYLGQFWHTLHEDESKYTYKFMLDRKELTLTLDDFRTIFHLPQATNNNHDHFVPTPTFSKMVPFYINDLGFTLELRSTSNFKTTSLLQPWQTLCKMFSRCLTTRVTGYDQPAVQIMQMLYFFVNNIHVDYAELLWENFYYSLKNPTTLIPYPRFTKLIVSHYMTTYLEISRRVRDRYHNLADDVMIKRIFNSGKSKDIGTHRTTSAPRSPKPVVAEGKSSAPPSLADQKSREELEATQNVENVKEHLIAEEIKKLVEGSEIVEETVEVTSSPFRNDDDQVDPNTRLESRSDKESPEVEKIADISQPMNVIKEEEESAEDDYGLRRREKGKYVEEIRITPSPTTIRSPRIPTNLSFFQELQGRYGYLFEHLSAKFMQRRKFNALAKNLEDIVMESFPKLVDERIKKILQTQERSNLRSEISSQVNDAIANHIPSQVDSSVRHYMSGHILHVWLLLLVDLLLFALEIRTILLMMLIDDDVLPNEKASQELVDEISQTVDKAKLCKVFDEMLRQQCTSRDGHRKEIIVPKPSINRIVPRVAGGLSKLSKNPKAPDYIPLVNQHFVILKEGANSGPIRSIIFTQVSFHQRLHFSSDDDLEEITSRLESDYKNLNKNDIEDMYLLIVNLKVDDYAETGLLWSLLVFIKSTVIWERVHDFQLGIIYENNKKEKRVMRHQEVHKFCDATLKIVLEGLKSYNNDVKYGYVTHNLSKEDVEYL